MKYYLAELSNKLQLYIYYLVVQNYTPHIVPNEN